MYHYSAKQLSESFKKGEHSAEEIALYFLKRIELYDPFLKSFLCVFKERILEKAKKLDAKKRKGDPLGKLAAIPIALKDTIHVQGELTTCGSKFLSSYEAVFDATVTTLLEQEDALLIGKTNLDEFAMGSSTEHSAFFPTKNPWDLTCSPGGSSGGSAAAVAAKLCPLALGSDTGGSIRQPASLCGVVGLKPTYGRVSRYGLVAFASSLDQIGPFSATVEDTALVMEVLGKHCSHDATSLPHPQETYTSHLKHPLTGKKIGVPWHFLEALNEESRKNFKEALEVFKELGASVVEISLDLSNYAVAMYYVLATAEASANLARFDGVRYGNRSAKAQTLDELYKLSREEGFGPEVKRRILLGTYVLSHGFKDAYYKKAQQIRTLMIREFKEAFQRCDILALPTSPSSAFPLGSIRDPLQMYLQDIYTIPANMTGMPAISLPSGFNSEGKPLGLQLIAPMLQESKLFNFSYAYENKTRWHTHLPHLIKDVS